MQKTAADLISLPIEMHEGIADTKFRLVHIASQRVRQLSAGAPPRAPNRSDDRLPDAPPAPCPHARLQPQPSASIGAEREAQFGGDLRVRQPARKKIEHQPVIAIQTLHECIEGIGDFFVILVAGLTPVAL